MCDENGCCKLATCSSWPEGKFVHPRLCRATPWAMASGALTEYMRNMRRPELERSAARWKKEVEVYKNREKTAKDRFSELGGAIVSSAAGAVLTGFVEERFRQNDGQRASVGPISLPFAAALGYLGLSLAFDKEEPVLATQLRYAASGNVGLLAGDTGRLMGHGRLMKVMARQQGTQVSGVEQVRPRPLPRHGPATRAHWEEDELDIGDEEWSPEEREFMGG